MNNEKPLTTVEIDNLKCGGCANTITKGLLSLSGVTNISVDPEKSTVSFGALQSKLPLVLAKLKSMGYPQKGTTHGFEAGLATTKSYVSCAIGRLS